MFKNRLCALACGFALALTGALAATTSTTVTHRTTVRTGRTVPQYWISDADIFIGNAAHTARVMMREQRIHVESPMVVSDQAAFIMNATGRALRDLRALRVSASSAKPAAVPSVRNAEAQLARAEWLARQVSMSAGRGHISSSYQANLQSAYTHLRAAADHLNGAARFYPGVTVTSVSMFGGGAGINGGAHMGAGGGNNPGNGGNNANPTGNPMGNPNGSPTTNPNGSPTTSPNGSGPQQ